MTTHFALPANANAAPLAQPAPTTGPATAQPGALPSGPTPGLLAALALVIQQAEAATQRERDAARTSQRALRARNAFD